MFDLAETRGVAALCIAERDLFLQRLEAGLTQQDRVSAGGRAFDHSLGRNAFGWHAQLDGVDVQGTWGQVVDVWALEGHDIGDQAMLVVQLLVLLGRDSGVLVPAEGVQRFLHERIGIAGAQAAVALALGDQLQHPRVKILRLARMPWASSRSCGLSISSRRSSEVNTRNGLMCRDCSCTARNAVECTGTPALLRS